MDLGVPSVPTFRYDSTDRNRTSPFAFTGNKFEFRMVGSSQNIAMANVMINTAVAKVCKDFADVLEGCEDLETSARALIKTTFKDHRRIIFNGNGYSSKWPIEAEKRGLLNFKTSVDAFACLTEQKNIDLFTEFPLVTVADIGSDGLHILHGITSCGFLRTFLFLSYRRMLFLSRKSPGRAKCAVPGRDQIFSSSTYIPTSWARGL
jgi:glutamine synthetase